MAWPSFGRDFFMLFSDLAGLTCAGPASGDKSARPVEWASLSQVNYKALRSHILRAPRSHLYLLAFGTDIENPKVYLG